MRNRSAYYADTTITADGVPNAQVNASHDVCEVAKLSGAAFMIRRKAIDDVGAALLLLRGVAPNGRRASKEFGVVLY